MTFCLLNKPRILDKSSFTSIFKRKNKHSSTFSMVPLMKARRGIRRQCCAEGSSEGRLSFPTASLPSPPYPSTPLDSGPCPPPAFLLLLVDFHRSLSNLPGITGLPSSCSLPVFPLPLPLILLLLSYSPLSPPIFSLPLPTAASLFLSPPRPLTLSPSSAFFRHHHSLLLS